MEQLIELLQQIQDLAGAGIDALQEALGAGGEEMGGEPGMEGGGGPPPEEGAPAPA